ncbi:beta-ketoacyl-ACP synthase [uncultured Sneathiella sp.]|jgi:3-oxoacyl-[acyl-carrier-protein] synthase II|uniref:beta-ketoacyl-ACP synthase n=1 Tax=uncultured Sneathiella sp. TaxID=879315 RepID=UPI0030D9060B|tara:strand:- start:3122 stop:4357 length:1236 start_codon:yes stop_codon:yes gene_type:complete
MTTRVVVTGMGGVTSLGEDWGDISTRMRAGETGIRRMASWDFYDGLNTRLAGPVEGFNIDDRYSRKALRSMGPVAKMSVYATERALEMAGLLNDPVLKSGRVGVAYGSSFGSTKPVLAFTDLMRDGHSRDLTATSYVKMMSHTTAVNIGVFFGLAGRVIPTSSACTSGSQGIGYAYEAIKYGLQDMMVAGGAEELCPTMAAVFDTLYATSIRNDEPHRSPRPFDKDRDGLVIGEGAATLVLESYDHAIARGAHILAEIVGFATNSDGRHITNPTQATMEVAMQGALDNAGLKAADIDFISGHGTATEQGDIAESQATLNILGADIPIHSLKSYFGHSLGACGAIEAWLGIEMMREGWFAPTANLENVDAACAEIDYVMGEGRNIAVRHLMSNNFAFGGINSSLIFRNSAEA